MGLCPIPDVMHALSQGLSTAPLAAGFNWELIAFLLAAGIVVVVVAWLNNKKSGGSE